jgi:hypothetical protein
MHMVTQGKLGKDLKARPPRVVCSAHERPRTQIQRSHA